MDFRYGIRDLRFILTEWLPAEEVFACERFRNNFSLDDVEMYLTEGYKIAQKVVNPINDMHQICQDPHIRHRKMLTDIEQPVAGPMRIAGSPIRLSETPGEVYAPAPVLGQHSAEVLRDVLGYSPETIRRLFQNGVVRGPESAPS